MCKTIKAALDFAQNCSTTAAHVLRVTAQAPVIAHNLRQWTTASCVQKPPPDSPIKIA
jgi:hypothetical protein